MANRWFNPDEQFADSTGAALSGAQLFFYATGTSTKQNTYSDSALTIANTNPVVLDSSGRAGSIFLQNLKYKVILAPSTDTDPPTSPIWTMDPVYASDVSALAQVQGSNGNPNGSLAGTQGSASVPASMAWDFVNNILYVCTTTGTISTAVWTAVNPGSSASVIPPPQGRLTLTSQTPVLAVDAIAATTVFYTPYVGLLVPIYNGTTFVPTSIVSELSATLVASHAANNIYDFYIFLLGGVATLGTGPTWSAGSGGSIAAGSCVRGTGAGGAALTRLQGILTNAVSMTMRYGNGTTTAVVSPNQGIYIGSMFMDGTNGQVTCHLSFGQSRKFGIWNAYNRQPIIVQAGDPTASWTYNTATIRQSNGAIGNAITVFTGLAEEMVEAYFGQTVQTNWTGSVTFAQRIGIGYNSTTAFSGLSAQANQRNDTNPLTISTVAPFAPALGINAINMLEQANSLGNTNNVFQGGAGNMLLEVKWRG